MGRRSGKRMGVGVLGDGGWGRGDNWQYCHVCMKSQTCYHQMLWLNSMQIQHIHPMHAIL